MRDSKYQGIHGAEKTKNPGKDQLIWGTEPFPLCPHSPSPLPFPPQVFVLVLTIVLSHQAPPPSPLEVSDKNNYCCSWDSRDGESVELALWLKEVFIYLPHVTFSLDGV